jgi:tetratricopeptide (TPR) repeat protein
MNMHLTTALELHQAGRFADAARRYDRLLSLEPDNADALHLYGVMHHECGYSDRAVNLIGRAIALRPEAAAFHSNLAEVYRELAQHEQAVECCHIALRLRPDYPEAANNLGLALQGAGRSEEALAAYLDALRMRPNFAMARSNQAIALRALGRMEEALEAFRAAVGLDPESAMARANLGQALIDADEDDEGLVQCLEAVRLGPDLAAGHNNLGNAYTKVGRRKEALAAYAEALRLSPELGGARVHANLGLALRRHGQIGRALSSLRRATELAPDDPEFWCYLAETHVEDEEHAAAIPCWERAIALSPERPEGHVGLGAAFFDEGRFAEATDCFRRAQELRPDDLEALMKQGGLHEALGEMTEAEASYRRACAAHPAAPGPLACLATLLRGRLPDDDREAIRARLEAAPLDDGPRANLLFGLAQVCDARGDYAEAAGCVKQANSLIMNRRREQDRVYDPAEHTRFVDRLIEGFPAELFARLRSVGDVTRQPVFVFGLPRSGTTLVEQILASHSRVYAAGELKLCRRTFDAIPEIVGRDDGIVACLSSLDDKAVGQLSQRHSEALHAFVNRDRPDFVPDRIVDKMPDNYLYLGLISILYPRATLIYVRRDPRDVVLSCRMTNFRSIRWANDPDHLAGRIQEHYRVMDHWRAVLPTAVHEVSYERLVENFEGEAACLVSACGLDWEHACLDFHQTSRPVRTASVTQVRQPLYRNSLARWRHYQEELRDLFGRLPVR